MKNYVWEFWAASKFPSGHHQWTSKDGRGMRTFIENNEFSNCRMPVTSGCERFISLSRMLKKCTDKPDHKWLLSEYLLYSTTRVWALVYIHCMSNSTLNIVCSAACCLSRADQLHCIGRLRTKQAWSFRKQVVRDQLSPRDKPMKGLASAFLLTLQWYCISIPRDYRLAW